MQWLIKPDDLRRLQYLLNVGGELGFNMLYIVVVVGDPIGDWCKPPDYDD